MMPVPVSPHLFGQGILFGNFILKIEIAIANKILVACPLKYVNLLTQVQIGAIIEDQT